MLFAVFVAAHPVGFIKPLSCTEAFLGLPCRLTTSEMHDASRTASVTGCLLRTPDSKMDVIPFERREARFTPLTLPPVTTGHLPKATNNREGQVKGFGERTVKALCL